MENIRWIIGSILTLGLFLLGVTFRMGHHSARIEALEKWRDNIRLDMHEISDAIQELDRKMTELMTLIEERTNRREIKR